MVGWPDRQDRDNIREAIRLYEYWLLVEASVFLGGREGAIAVHHYIGLVFYDK
jgi:hypothetical protein